MPEVRLGSFENMANINLGSVEIQEVRLGTVLVWRNNIPPFYQVRVGSVTGSIISNNGTPASPVDPVSSALAPIQTYAYLDTIPIFLTGLDDEDMHYPVTYNLYQGDFDADPTLLSLDSATAASAGANAQLNVPRGPSPTGATAANFIYTNRLYSIVAEDNEEGVSIQYFRITSTDSPDARVLGSWTNSGSTFGSFSNPLVQAGLTRTVNTQCFDPISSTITFTRTTPRTQASQAQVRTCSVTVNGVTDSPALTCTGFTNRTVTVTVSTGTPTEATTGTVNFTNTGYVTGATVSNTVGGTTCTPISASVTDGTCGSCTANFNIATCNSTLTRTTQPRCQGTNCNGSFVGSPMNNGAASTSTVNCAGTNSSFVTQSPSCSSALETFSGVPNGRVRWTATTNRNGYTMNASCTCVDGSSDSTSRSGGSGLIGFTPSTLDYSSGTTSASGDRIGLLCNSAAEGGCQPSTLVATFGSGGVTVSC